METNDTININGIEYVTKSSVTDGTDHQIVIVKSGWIFIGYVEHDADVITIKNADVVRSWANKKGIGGLSIPEYKNEYTLDKVCGNIHVPYSSVLACIDCGW